MWVIKQIFSSLSTNCSCSWCEVCIWHHVVLMCCLWPFSATSSTEQVYSYHLSYSKVLKHIYLNFSLPVLLGFFLGVFFCNYIYWRNKIHSFLLPSELWTICLCPSYSPFRKHPQVKLSYLGGLYIPLKLLLPTSAKEANLSKE